MASTSSIIDSKCFICSASFDARSLPQHEKECLASLQDNLTTITKEVDTLLDVESESVKSANSTGSSEGSGRKKVRCYICGCDFPAHFITVHERQCKRNWETGVTKNDSLRKGSSLGNISSPLGSNPTDSIRNARTSSGLKKAQSVANVSHREPKQAWNARMRENEAKEKKSIEKRKTQRRKPRPLSAYAALPMQGPRSPFCPGSEVAIFDDTKLADDSGIELIDIHNDIGSDVQSSSPRDSPQQNTGTPRFTDCKYCSNKFIIHSIGIHEKKCRTRVEKENQAVKKKPTQNGRCFSVSELRFAMDDRDWSVEKSLDQSFAAASVDRLNGYTEKRPSSALRNMRFFPCHLCGKQFGSKSLAIHEKQCEKARELQNAKNNEKARLPRRKDYQRMYHSEVNLHSGSQSMQHQSPSPTFSDRSRTPSSSFKTPRQRRPSSEKNLSQDCNGSVSDKKRTPSSGNYVRCHFCNNYYGSASVKIHEVRCGLKMEKAKDDATPQKLSRTPRKQTGSVRRLFDLQR